MANRSQPEGGFKEIVMTVLYAVVIALTVRTVAFEPFNIPSGSMIPTLLVGDYIFVSKWSYGYSRYSLPLSVPLIPGRIFATLPERGDVAVFRFPPKPSEDYIKRVIGLPGDTIQMKRGVLFINGKEVPKERVSDYVGRDSFGNVERVARYIETLPGVGDKPGVRHEIDSLSQTHDGRFDNTAPFLVPPGHYFMMGDNRDNSNDSRGDVGMVPVENFIGKATRVFFSTNQSAAVWEFWKWPWAIRWERLMHDVRGILAPQ